MHGSAHERRRVKRNHRFHAFREEGTQFVELCLNAGCRCQSVGAGTQADCHTRRRLTVVAALEGIGFLTKRNFTDILDANDGTVGQRLQSDLLELFGRIQQGTCSNRSRDHALAVGGLTGNITGGHLHVLRADGTHHVGNFETVFDQKRGIHPDAHCIGGTEHRHFADTLQTGKRLFDVVRQKVTQVTRGELSRRVDKTDHLQE